VLSGVRKAAPADGQQLAEALAAAFYEDPVFAWLLPNERRRTAALRRFFVIELSEMVLAHGDAWTNEHCTGGALSLPPGRWRMPWRVLLGQAAAYAHIFKTRLLHATALITVLESRHIREPHYYFPYIGVVPSAQGQGLGTQLMQPTLALSDEKQIPCYLEATSERNASLYARLGFRAVGEISVAGSPKLVPMVRAPTDDVQAVGQRVS